MKSDIKWYFQYKSSQVVNKVACWTSYMFHDIDRPGTKQYYSHVTLFRIASVIRECQLPEASVI